MDMKLQVWPEAGTQNYKILCWMQANGAITPLDALDYAGSFRLSERCRELEGMGWEMERKRVKTAGGAHVMSYRLKP
jgi:hypothetical protein